MRLTGTFVPVGALVIALGAAPLQAAAAQRHEGQDRGGRQSREAGPDRAGDRGDTRDRGEGRDRGDGRADRGDGREYRGRAIERRGDERPRIAERPRIVDRRDVYVYQAPRVVAPRPIRPYRGGTQLFFSWGTGYRYGSPYRGRVYGYSAPVVEYGPGRYYGDVRLQVKPRDAAVYVDGYYAGVVDNFDGVFQRLTLEAGPHRIEIEAPGLEPRSFDVRVDPYHDIDLRADLQRDRY